MASRTERRSRLIRIVVAMGQFPREVQTLVTRLTSDQLAEAWEAATELAQADCCKTNESAEILACWCTTQEIERIARRS